MKNNDLFEKRTDLTNLNEAVDKIKSEINRFIVGQSDMIELLIAAFLADGHALIEGVPGTAKTLTAKLIARTVSTNFSRIQFTPDLMPSDVLGTSVFNMKTSSFEFKQGPVFSNLILIDEINRAPAKTQAALFEVMEERQVTVDGNTYKMKDPFIVIATQNPIEHEGTYRLPEAQIDRFLFKIKIDYPSKDEESKILTEHHQRRHINDIMNIKAVISEKEIIHLKNIVRGLHAEPKLIEYITQIIQASRNHASIYLGGSPRAAIAVLIGAKAVAAMNGRDFITPEDIKRICKPALAHRILLTPEREMEGVTPEQVIDEILMQIEVPR